MEKLPPNFLSLEEALELSKEEEEALYCCQRYHLDIEAEKFEIIAIGWHGEWVFSHLERGLKEAFKRMEQMLGWEQSQYVGIRTGVGEVEDRKDITAIGKVEWQGEMKYTVGLYSDYTGGLVKEFKAEGVE